MSSEASILRNIRLLLDLLQSANKLVYTRVHVMPVWRQKGHLKIACPNKDMAGFSDLEVVANGKIGYIEVKASKGKLTDYQRKFLDLRKKHGAFVCVARSTKDVEQFLKHKLGVSF